LFLLLHYFRRKVLEIQGSDGLNDMGDMRWSLAFCVFIVFLMVYFSLWKGVRSTGKVRFSTSFVIFYILWVCISNCFCFVISRLIVV